MAPKARSPSPATLPDSSESGIAGSVPVEEKPPFILFRPIYFLLQ